MRRLTLLVLVLVAGCGGASTPAAKSAPSTTSSATATASPTPSGPSIQQVASAVAQVKANLVALQADLQHTCEARTQLQRLGCSFIVDRAPLEGQNGKAALQKLGLVPAELTELMGQTMQALQPVAELKYRACDKNQDTTNCDIEVVTAEIMVKRALQQMSGWDPYL